MKASEYSISLSKEQSFLQAKLLLEKMAIPMIEIDERYHIGFHNSVDCFRAKLVIESGLEL